MPPPISPSRPSLTLPHSPAPCPPSLAPAACWPCGPTLTLRAWRQSDTRRRQEEELISHSEDRLSDLEKEELALIESLQRCQDEQRHAYHSIDEALMAGGKKLSQAELGSMLEGRAPLR